MNKIIRRRVGRSFGLSEEQDKYWLYSHNGYGEDFIVSFIVPILLSLDHLGSSSLITNLDGETVQHIESVPFGEVFIEERNNKWNTPYLFNAKELDEETGLYYYGARYYNPREVLFLSVDQMVEKTGTPYQYCYQNPIRYTDPTGMVPGDGDGGGNERILPRTEPLKHGGSWYRNVGVFAHNTLASFTNVVYDVGESLIQESIFIYNNGAGAYLSNFGNSVSNSVSSTYNYLANTPGSEILSNEWNAFKSDMTNPYAWSDAVGKTAWMFTPVKGAGNGSKALTPTIKTPAVNIGPPASSIAAPKGNFYSVAFEMQLPSSMYPGTSYWTHFKTANTALSKAIATDPVFANSMSKLGISIPKSSTGSILGKSPTNWVWNHGTTPGTMQLVPKVQHTPGSIFWETIHPNGKGGMSLWGN